MLNLPAAVTAMHLAAAEYRQRAAGHRAAVDRLPPPWFLPAADAGRQAAWNDQAVGWAAAATYLAEALQGAADRLGAAPALTEAEAGCA